MRDILPLPTPIRQSLLRRLYRQFHTFLHKHLVDLFDRRCLRSVKQGRGQGGYGGTGEDTGRAVDLEGLFQAVRTRMSA
jgi:hypothetical protein